MSINLYSIKSILNIKDENITFDEDFYFKKKINYQDTHIFSAKLSYVPKACTCCGVVNDSSIIVKNGFKLSRIKLLPISSLPAILELKKQRFVCRSCDSSFMASSSFVDYCSSISNGVKNSILLGLTSVSSVKDIAKECFVSSSTVLRILKGGSVLKKDFSYPPEFICMDEFKSVSSESFRWMHQLKRSLIFYLIEEFISLFLISIDFLLRLEEEGLRV